MLVTDKTDPSKNKQHFIDTNGLSIVLILLMLRDYFQVFLRGGFGFYSLALNKQSPEKGNF